MIQYEKTWRTKDGRVLPIHKMTDEHIVNAIRMCQRQGFVGEMPSYPSGLNGEMAQYYAEHEWQEAMEKYLPALGWLEEEADRRGLKI